MFVIYYNKDVELKIYVLLIFIFFRNKLALNINNFRNSPLHLEFSYDALLKKINK